MNFLSNMTSLGEEAEGLLLTGPRISIWGAAFGTGGDGCTLGMYLMSLNCTLKVVKMANLMQCVILPQ